MCGCVQTDVGCGAGMEVRGQLAGVRVELRLSDW